MCWMLIRSVICCTGLNIRVGIRMNGKCCTSLIGAWVRKGKTDMTDMNQIVGSHDIVMITLDTLRYDVAKLEEENCPNLCGSGSWEKRHTPGSFTYAAHHAFLADFCRLQRIRIRLHISVCFTPRIRDCVRIHIRGCSMPRILYPG